MKEDSVKTIADGNPSCWLAAHEHVGDGSSSMSLVQPSANKSACFFTFLFLSF